MKFLPSEDTTPCGVVSKSMYQRLKRTNPEKLAEAVRALASKPCTDVINDFSSSFHSDQRIAAFACSEALTAMGVPPAFRHSHLSRTDFSLEQRLDLLTYDVRWIRLHYPEHVKKVRYQRYRTMLGANERTHHAEIEHAFYDGRRKNWKIVKALELPESIQFECKVLQSAPVAKRQQATGEQRDEVYLILKDHLSSVRKTKTFTAEDAKATLDRRFQIWLCSRMSNGSLIEIAKIYKAKTGKSITSEIVSRQLKIAEEIIHKRRDQNKQRNDML